MNDSGNTNRLIKETSPYLLQHAHNPVNWYPWGDEALKEAQKNDLPIIVSIGYSSCHWCHVMERESFEDEKIAQYMNDHFICIKVDREERPDVDQIYMDAVQAMGINGGWPLNVFLTPDQKPFYGGTYFQSQSWLQLLKNVINTFSNQREELNSSAEKLASHISESDVLKFNLVPEEEPFLLENLKSSINELSDRFDLNKGGLQKAPKFPMPSIWNYLLRYAHFTTDKTLTDHVLKTLEKIARGGIYDQIGGGFSRYSVDAEWFVPHFEKMLYDNGQLISLYSDAYLVSGNKIFKEVVYDTISFVDREMTNPAGGFYAALDADSEGIEGKYYTWDYENFCHVVGNESKFWADYFSITPNGNWEKQRNILTQHININLIKNEFKINTDAALEKFRDIKRKLLVEREKRIRPGLDNKILAGWNGLVLKGLIDAYHSFGQPEFLKLALKNAEYLKIHHYKEEILYRTPFKEYNAVQGYLEDYAFVIRGLINLYQATFDESWLNWAEKLVKYSLHFFYDESENLFFFNGNQTNKLIARKKELFDNVIPSSNSEMAINLFLLGLLKDLPEYSNLAEKMIKRMNKLIVKEPEYLANWRNLYMMYAAPFAEIAIIGKESLELKDQLSKHYIPNKIFCGTDTNSELPLLKDKKITGRTTIFVCYNKTCRLPVQSIEDALELIQ